jgi:hypothetical protein
MRTLLSGFQLRGEPVPTGSPLFYSEPRSATARPVNPGSRKQALGLMRMTLGTMLRVRKSRIVAQWVHVGLGGEVHTWTGWNWFFMACWECLLPPQRLPRGSCSAIGTSYRAIKATQKSKAVMTVEIATACNPTLHHSQTDTTHTPALVRIVLNKTIGKGTGRFACGAFIFRIC